MGLARWYRNARARVETIREEVDYGHSAVVRFRDGTAARFATQNYVDVWARCDTGEVLRVRADVPFDLGWRLYRAAARMEASKTNEKAVRYAKKVWGSR